MSIIIADTTPLRYLIEIEEVHVLERLFGKIIIPEKVAEELQRPQAPQAVDAMQKTSFRLPPVKTIEEMLERDRKRKEAEEQE